MTIESLNLGWIRSATGTRALQVISIVAILAPLWAAQGQTESAPSASTAASHMPEELRTTVRKVVVIPGQFSVNQDVTGSYEKTTDGLIGGIDSGSRIGTVSKDIGGVPVNVPIPGLAIPGAIYGGLSGAAKREIQEMRDELTERLADAGSEPLSSDGLALDVYRGIQKMPNVDAKLYAPTTPVPEDTNAILYVGINGIAIDVQGKDAIITTAAGVTLRRLSDDAILYETIILYQDRDTLDNWTDDENALWQDYANFARHYLGRELSADLYDRIVLPHELTPRGTESAKQAKKNRQLFESRSLAPMLAWELNLLGGDSYDNWPVKVDESSIYYDIEIYDSHQLVYEALQIQRNDHSLGWELEPCLTYRWSVRPSYHVGDDIRYGQWMRFDSDDDTFTGKGIIGRNASEAPALTQDYPQLEIACGRL